MKVVVIILNWNGKDDTLASLATVSHPHIIVVDNGSTDGSVAAIRAAYPTVQLIEAGVNLGYAGGNNVGIEKALEQGADAVLLLNNDTVVDPGFVEAFIASATENPSIGIWGGYPLQFHDPLRLDHLGGVWNPEKGDFDLVGLHQPSGFRADQPLDYVCGCSIFIQRAVFDAVGLLEPKFFLFWEEADLAMRAKKAGFGVAVCYSAHLRHKVSASFIGGSPHKKYFWWRGRLLWIERNCLPQEKRALFRKIVYPELWHYTKLYWIKRILSPAKKQKLAEYRAIQQAIRDFLRGAFGPGPAWLFARDARSLV